MEFIKQMKKREFIEMGLKTLAAVMAAFLAIILMEGMIYGIKLNAFETKGSTSISNSGTTVADNIDHFTSGLGQRKLAIATTRTISIIRPTPVNCNPPIIFAANAVITCPILLCSNTFINNDAKNINTNILPELSRL